MLDSRIIQNLCLCAIIVEIKVTLDNIAINWKMFLIVMEREMLLIKKIFKIFIKGTFMWEIIICIDIMWMKSLRIMYIIFLVENLEKFRHKGHYVYTA